MKTPTLQSMTLAQLIAGIRSWNNHDGDGEATSDLVTSFPNRFSIIPLYDEQETVK